MIQGEERHVDADDTCHLRPFSLGWDVNPRKIGGPRASMEPKDVGQVFLWLFVS